MVDRHGPAIVVAAYNRAAALTRLLQSLAEADYPDDVRVPLVISIDHGGPEEVAAEAESFHWNFGPKELIRHSANLGLREHILSCGDLSERFDAVIVLEDDLFVSPAFYRYTVDALEHYADADDIGGISLYSHCSVPYLRKPFEPLVGEGDTFFLQFASSWGQAWSAEQWSRFREWYGEGRNVTPDDPLPEAVLNWPDSSWLKRFNKYLVESGRYFVYPRVSLTTNFGDPGVHFSRFESFFQVPLVQGKRTFQMTDLADEVAVYDAHFELLPDRLNRITDRLSRYDYEVDTYGSKNVAKVRAAYLLTTRPCRNATLRFGLRMQPPLANVVNGVAGTGLSLCPRDAEFGDINWRPTFDEFDARYSAKLGFWYALKKVMVKLWRLASGGKR